MMHTCVLAGCDREVVLATSACCTEHFEAARAIAKKSTRQAPPTSRERRQSAARMRAVFLLRATCRHLSVDLATIDDARVEAAVQHIERVLGQKLPSGRKK